MTRWIVGRPGPGRAAPLHRLPSRLEDAGPPADAARDADPGAEDRAGERRALRLHRQRPRRGRRQHLLPRLRRGAHRPRLVRADRLEPDRGRPLRELRHPLRRPLRRPARTWGARRLPVRLRASRSQGPLQHPVIASSADMNLDWLDDQLLGEPVRDWMMALAIAAGRRCSSSPWSSGSSSAGSAASPPAPRPRSTTSSSRWCGAPAGCWCSSRCSPWRPLSLDVPRLQGVPEDRGHPRLPAPARALGPGRHQLLGGEPPQAARRGGRRLGHHDPGLRLHGQGRPLVGHPPGGAGQPRGGRHRPGRRPRASAAWPWRWRSRTSWATCSPRSRSCSTSRS